MTHPCVYPTSSLQEARRDRSPTRPSPPPFGRPPSRTGVRLLHPLLSVLMRAFGSPCERVPAEVHRAFHRGASLVLVVRTPDTPWRVEWSA